MPYDDGQAGRPQPWTLDLRASTPTAMAQLRRWVADLLPELDTPHLDDVLLVATELVTSAHDHGHGPQVIRVVHSSVPCRVRIEVDDNHYAAYPVVTSVSRGPRGRGMMLVQLVAHQWGVHDHWEAGTKTVWAEISCDHADAIACRPRRPAVTN